MKNGPVASEKAGEKFRRAIYKLVYYSVSSYMRSSGGIGLHKTGENKKEPSIKCWYYQKEYLRYGFTVKSEIKWTTIFNVCFVVMI